MRSPVRIWVAAPKIPENCGFRGFFVAKSYFTGWPKISDPHRDPHAEYERTEAVETWVRKSILILAETVKNVWKTIFSEFFYSL